MDLLSRRDAFNYNFNGTIAPGIFQSEQLMSDHTIFRTGLLFVLTLVIAAGFQACPSPAQESASPAAGWQLGLRQRVATGPNSGRYHTITRQESWEPARTAIIVCDMWDAHHSINAVRRVGELAPRIDQVLKLAREQDATIIHAPSDCMEQYVDHPARKRAQGVTSTTPVPAAMNNWCNRIDAEEAVVYPLDQSDGGEDDDLAEHAAWAEELRARGLNPGSPWKTQTSAIEIDSDRDFVSDNGGEIWNILESRGIENVILCGVHTNMCVLGRPFGLRNLAAAGKRVVLLRDLTDTMYNPNSWPYVSHFTGTDLIIEHIEKVICPTITSDQLAGGKAFRFAADKRPTVAIVMAEDEYETERTLPQFAAGQLGHDFRVELIYASDTNPNEIPGLELIDEADVIVVSVRRRPLPQNQMEILRRFVASGKPVIGIRTASHAFLLREGPPPDGLTSWPEFDGEVLGGNYSGHHGNEFLPSIQLAADPSGHVILAGLDPGGFVSGGSLYKTSPLNGSAEVLLNGSISGQPAEPVAWIFNRVDGGKSFCTSLGHKQDFENPSFRRMLFNSLLWATDQASKDPPDRSSLSKPSAGN